MWLRNGILVHVGTSFSHGSGGSGMCWDPKALFPNRDKYSYSIDEQLALVKRCFVCRRGKERVAGSVSLTYGAVGIALEN